MANPFAYTPVKFEYKLEKFKPRARLVSLGSCFAEDVLAHLCPVRNPNGILYHPLAISYAVSKLQIGYTATDFFEYGGLHHSWAHHGSFSDADLNTAVKKAETARKNFLKALKKADGCFITLSSAVLYTYLPLNRSVANCHKLPGNEFARTLSGTEQCAAALRCIVRDIREINPDCKVIFTLSPVRHYPGELTLNAISKARLLEAIYTTVERFENTGYFPAYEIQTDELRDYRFYAEDLVHPSEEAKKIILDRLLDTCFTPEAKEVYLAAEKKRKAAAHRPLHPQPEQNHDS